MRCRGVSVNSAETQVGSQKPHSIHLSIFSLAAGIGFRFLRCASGSLFRITPGLSKFWGSKICLMRFISPKASRPHSISTNGAMLRPVPCSALSEPSYFFTTKSATSAIKPAYLSISLVMPKSCVKTKCKFPSSA